MKPVTIDKLDIKDHIRWAQDRAAFDTNHVQESKEVAPHPEITGTSIIFSSQLEELFSWEKGMLPWANFSPPHNLSLFHKRLFAYRLFPHISSEENTDDDEEETASDQEQQDEQEEIALRRAKDLIQFVIAIQKNANQSHSHFEKDKSSILSLLESIRFIDDMLAQISSRKLQYQKG
jgi:hypothetical protein